MMNKVRNLFKYALINKITPHPSILSFVVTHRCNARCIMCNLWRERTERDLSLNQIEEIFQDPFFKSIRAVMLTGGEPTLREDLAGIVAVLLRNCPHLKEVRLATNGLSSEVIIQRTQEILKLLAGKLLFSIQMSLDGLGKTHEEIRGVPQAYHRVLETIEAIRKLNGVSLSLACLIQPLNIEELDRIREVAGGLSIPIEFTPVIFSEYYYRNASQDDLKLKVIENLRVRDFLKKISKDDYSPVGFYYRDLIQILKGEKRRLGCLMGRDVFNLEHNGDVPPCANYEEIKFGNVLNDSLKEIWFSKRTNDLRKKMKRYCRPCPAICSLNPFNYFMTALKMGKVFRVVRERWMSP